MKITMESTDKIVTLNGIAARLWEGETASGIPVVVFVTRVAVPNDKPCGEFEKELTEHRAPRPDLAGAFDARLIL